MSKLKKLYSDYEWHVEQVRAFRVYELVDQTLRLSRKNIYSIFLQDNL